MKDFEEMKSNWMNIPNIKTPKNGSEQIIKKIDFLKKKQLILNMILGSTIIVLIAFFLYIAAYKYSLVAFALSLMIFSLVIRALIENHSRNKLKNINVTTDAETFKKEIINYYHQRIKVHYILTPIIVVTYIVGFIILLPFFKETLSAGFYLYVKLSAIVLLVVFAILIRKQLKKELKLIKDISV